MTTGQIGTIVILVLALAVLVGGYIAYRTIREKVRNISRMAFGTEKLSDGIEKMEKEFEKYNDHPVEM